MTLKTHHFLYLFFFTGKQENSMYLYPYVRRKNLKLWISKWRRGFISRFGGFLRASLTWIEKTATWNCAIWENGFYEEDTASKLKKLLTVWMKWQCLVFKTKSMSKVYFYIIIITWVDKYSRMNSENSVSFCLD